jgi:hypothetical protein
MCHHRPNHLNSAHPDHSSIGTEIGNMFLQRYIPHYAASAQAAKAGKGMLWSAGERNIRGISYIDAGRRHGLETNNDIFMLFLCVLRSDFSWYEYDETASRSRMFVLILEHSCSAGEVVEEDQMSRIQPGLGFLGRRKQRFQI